jgi:hypothetical protein
VPLHLRGGPMRPPPRFAANSVPAAADLSENVRFDLKLNQFSRLINRAMWLILCDFAQYGIFPHTEASKRPGKEKLTA